MRWHIEFRYDKWRGIMRLCLTTRCLFDYALHPSVSISHTTHAYILEREKEEKETVQLVRSEEERERIRKRK